MTKGILKMKKAISFFLVVSLLITMLYGSILTVHSSASTPIAVMIEEGGFSSSNTTGDSGTTLLWSKGTTDIDSGTIRFTNTARQAGAVVKRNQVKLTDGFSTYFKIYFSSNADGIAFLLYKADEPKLGDYGGALGYADADADDWVDKAIGNSIVVEFDTWNNYEGLDGQSWQSNWNNHVGIMFEGNAKHSTQSDSGNAVSLSAGLQGNYINAWVDYDGSIITVTYGTSATRSEGTTLTRAIQADDNVPLAGDDVYIGFTSSTGDNVTTHKLLKWYFMDT